MVRERRALHRSCWALIALALPQAALASATAGVTLSELSRLEPLPSPTAPLDLVVNGGSRGTVHVVLRGGDALVPVEDLELAGLRGFAGERERIDGRLHVALASLAPALRFEVDDAALALRVTARAELLGRRSIDLRPSGRPLGLEVDGDPSGFLNYSAHRRTDGMAGGFLEVGASDRGRLLHSSAQLLEDGRAVRGLSSLALDDVAGLRRLVVGDGFAASSALGGGVLLGGVSLVREYGIDPYFVRAPLPRLAGFASTPSTLDVYLNGVLARQVPLAPGGYDVSNLPVTAGAGDVRTVLRDAFGRSETIDWRYYYTAGLLAPGLSDFGYAIGFRRLDYGRESFAYGRPVFLGRHRVGAGEALTLGGRLDAATDFVSGGPAATVGLPFGSLDLEAAASVEDGALGAAGSIAYSFVSRRFSGGALLRLMGPRYAHAALRATDDRPRLQTSLYAGAPVGARLHVGLDYALLDRRDAGRSDALSARADLRLVRGLTLGLSGRRTTAPRAAAGYDLFATLSFGFAPMSVADVGVHARRGGDADVAAGIQRGLPAGTGFGYRARTTSAPAGGSATGVVQAQWDHGRYELAYDRVDGRGLATATVAGGVVLIGERVFLTRPVQQGYGLVRVGVPGVRAFSEGQEIGRTDRRGDLLVPTLLPYYGNRLAIADRDVPFAYRIGETELLAAPTLRAGIVTRFDVEPLRVVEGELVTPGAAGDRSPAYGELTLRDLGVPLSSPIGGDGRFYLESVPPGAHAAEVEWSGGRCRAELAIPPSPALVELGRVRCEPMDALVQDELRAVPARPALSKLPAAEGAATDPGAAAAVRPAEPPTAARPAPAVHLAAAGGGPTAPRGAPAPATSASALPEPRADAEPPPRVAGSASVALPAPPPPRGYGPRSWRCPTCAVCLSAAQHRPATPTAVAQCVSDLMAMVPTRSRESATDGCLARPKLDELCAACVAVRRLRSCPTWPEP